MAKVFSKQWCAEVIVEHAKINGFQSVAQVALLTKTQTLKELRWKANCILDETSGEVQEATARLLLNFSTGLQCKADSKYIEQALKRISGYRNLSL